MSDPISAVVGVASFLSGLFKAPPKPTPTPKAQGQLAKTGPSPTEIKLMQDGSTLGHSANFTSTTGNGNQPSNGGGGAAPVSNASPVSNAAISGTSASGRK
jgi:hypothetical protein